MIREALLEISDFECSAVPTGLQGDRVGNFVEGGERERASGVDRSRGG